MVPFYDLCDHLRNLDIEVGVAIPGVKKYTDEDPEKEIKDSKSSKKKNGSKIFGLIIKSRGVSIIYHYEPNDKSENKMTMKFTIECLKIILGKQTHSERIFWNAYCEIKGIDMVLTKQNALFLNKTLMGMKEAERIEVKNKTNNKTYNDFRFKEEITTNLHIS